MATQEACTAGDKDSLFVATSHNLALGNRTVTLPPGETDSSVTSKPLYQFAPRPCTRLREYAERTGAKPIPMSQPIALCSPLSTSNNSPFVLGKVLHLEGVQNAAKIIRPGVARANYDRNVWHGYLI